MNLVPLAFRVAFKTIREKLMDALTAKGKADLEIRKHVITMRHNAYTEASAVLPTAFAKTWNYVSATFPETTLNKSISAMSDVEKSTLFSDVGFTDQSVKSIETSIDKDSEFEVQYRKIRMTRSSESLSELHPLFHRHSLSLPRELHDKLEISLCYLNWLHAASAKRFYPNSTNYDKGELDRMHFEFGLKLNSVVNNMSHLFRQYDPHSYDSLS